MKTLTEWLGEGPFTLALSSSFFGFYAHCGIATAMHELGLKPQKITGASAGALVGAAMASGMTPDQLRDVLFTVEQKDFWDPRPGLGYLRGKKFRELLARHMVDSFEKTQIPLEIAVFDLFSWKTKFLNSGCLPSAIGASCAVPLMFHPVRRGWRYLVDGGVFRKSGMKHEDQHERILCIFLESDGWMGAYESKTTFKYLAPHHKVLRFKNLPRVSHSALANGPAAYKATLERAKAAFQMPMSDFLLDA